MKRGRSTELDPVWNALRDPTRRFILDLLREQPRTVGELCEEFAPELSRFAVMKHLKVLTAAGLVIQRTEGRKTWNQLNAVPIQRIHERWVTKYESLWAERLLSLERHVSTAATSAEQVEPLPLDSFRIEHEIELSRGSDEVFDALLEVDAWWRHRIYVDQPDSHMELEPVAGGRFLERCAAGEAHWGSVQQINPGRLLRLHGSLGMGAAPVVSVYEYKIRPTAAGTRLRLAHQVFGWLKLEWRAAHESGWRKLADSLREYVEHGKRWENPAMNKT